MIKHIIFDIGNVLLEFQPYDYFKEYPNGVKVCEYIFQSEIWNTYDQGLVTFNEVKDTLCELHPKYKNEIHYIMKEWLNILKPKQYSLHKLETLKQQGYSIYLLSNLSIDARNHIVENYSFFELADGYVLSYQEQVNKPNVEIYERLISKFQLLPKECVFLDDLKDNIDAAIAFGMQGIVFKSDEQVEKELQALLSGE